VRKDTHYGTKKELHAQPPDTNTELHTQPPIPATSQEQKTLATTKEEIITI
jgi:hypothetical protein